MPLQQKLLCSGLCISFPIKAYANTKETAENTAKNSSQTLVYFELMQFSTDGCSFGVMVVEYIDKVAFATGNLHVLDTANTLL